MEAGRQRALASLLRHANVQSTTRARQRGAGVPGHVEQAGHGPGQVPAAEELRRAFDTMKNSFLIRNAQAFMTGLPGAAARHAGPSLPVSNGRIDANGKL